MEKRTCSPNLINQHEGVQEELRLVQGNHITVSKRKIIGNHVSEVSDVLHLGVNVFEQLKLRNDGREVAVVVTDCQTMNIEATHDINCLLDGFSLHE
jgi:hypothetical protein